MPGIHVRSRTVATTADHPARGCKVSTGNCVRCHMPKYTLPQMHAAFTDHDIRIVRDSSDVPDRWSTAVLSSDDPSLLFVGWAQPRVNLDSRSLPTS